MDERVARLFEPVEIAGVRVRNRVVMAPMTRRLAPDDCVASEGMARYYARRAAGGVGVILTEGTHIEPVHAPDSGNVPGIWNDAQVAGWARVVEAVHAEGGAIGCQLWHTGRLAMDPIGPSAIAALDRAGKARATPKAMTLGDIERVCGEFARAARNAQRAGFDLVEVHGAHGYLLDSFVSPEANRRDDEFGGGFEGRIRMPVMVARAVREAVGDGYAVWYRLSQWRVDAHEAMAYPTPEALGVFVRALRGAGVDVVHASTRDMTAPAFAGSSRTLAGWVRESGPVATVAVGGATLSAGMGEGGEVRVTDPAPLAGMIERGEADLVAVGRALLANADWCDVVRDGRWRDLRPYRQEMLATLDE